jgi:hypothetical protein
MRTRPFAFISSLGLLFGLTGCETHIHGLTNGAVVYSDDVPPLTTAPGSNTTVGALQPVTDVGGTLAFQKRGTGADEIQIGTTLPHSEVAFFLNDGDPELVFQRLRSQTNWGPISEEDKRILSFGIAPRVTRTPGDLSTWTTEGANGGGDPNQTADVALFKAHSGVWRMDHGACSLSVPKDMIISTAITHFKNQGTFPIDVNFHRVEGVSYVSHPGTSAPWADNSGGILLNASGTATSSQLAVLSQDVASVVAAFITGAPLLALFGFETQIRDINFALTVANRVDIDSQNLLTSSMSSEISSVSHVGDCGFNIGNVFTSGAIGVCLDSQVKSTVDQKANDLSDVQKSLSTVFNVALPKNLVDIGTATATGGKVPCPTYDACSAPSDCVASGHVGSSLSGIFDGSGVPFNAISVPKANVNFDLTAANPIAAITGLTTDRTVPGLNSTNNGSNLSDIWSMAQAQLTNADNWSCAAIDMSSLSKPPVTEACPTLPTGHVCQYNLHAKRVNHYADSMEIVWYDELDKALLQTPALLGTIALGEISRLSMMSTATPKLCSVETGQFTDVTRDSPDGIKTSGF